VDKGQLDYVALPALIHTRCERRQHTKARTREYSRLVPDVLSPVARKHLVRFQPAELRAGKRESLCSVHRDITGCVRRRTWQALACWSVEIGSYRGLPSSSISRRILPVSQRSEDTVATRTCAAKLRARLLAVDDVCVETLLTPARSASGTCEVGCENVSRLSAAERIPLSGAIPRALAHLVSQRTTTMCSRRCCHAGHCGHRSKCHN
jgi:hypothetical protein